MRFTPNSKRGSFILFAFTLIFICFSVQSVNARQSERPFSLDLNFGGGLIGNSGTGTAFQPELGFSYMPGRWGVGINAGLFHFDSGFNADQYRAGFEEYTVSEQNEDRWRSYFINAGPRFEQSLSRVVSMKLGLDLAMNYQEGPSQSVRFNDPTGEMENAGFDTNIVLADMNGSADAGWSAAIRPQLQLEFSPGFSERFSFNIRTGIQHHLSDREITYSTRDISEVRPMDNVYEMHFQFDNAPVVQRTETAPKTNFFANAGIKIRFGKSSRGLHPEGVIHRDVAARNSAAPAQDYNAARSNKPTTRASDIGDGDMDSDDDGIDDAVEMAQDYNSSRSNKPNTNRIADGDNGQILREAIRMAMMVNPAGTVMSAGQVLTSIKSENPLHQEETREGENPLYEGQANDGDSGDNSQGNPVSVQRFDLQPSSYCVDLSSDSQEGMRTDAQATRGIDKKDIRRGEVDSDGFPEFMKFASFSISKRSARTGRNSEVETVEYRDGDARSQVSDSDGDGYGDVDDLNGDAEGLHIELEIDDLRSRVSDVISNMDSETPSSRADSSYYGRPGLQVAPSQTKVILLAITDSGEITPLDESDLSEFEFSSAPDSDVDGLMDAVGSATFSISKSSTGDDDPCGPGVWARTTGGSENCTPENSEQENPLAQESGWQETPALETGIPNNVHQWTYNLSSLADGQNMPGGTLTVLFTGGKWHFNVQLDPDDDGDGFGDLWQNSSFSIREKGVLSIE